MPITSATPRLFTATLALLLALLLSACTGMQPGYEQPSVNVSSFRSLPSEGIAPRFEIGLHIVNPNASPLKMRGISYGISLAGHKVITGVANDLPEIAGYGEGNVTLVASIDLLSGIGLIADLVQEQREDLEYSFDAKLDIGALQPAIRVSRSGTVTLGGKERKAGT